MWLKSDHVQAFWESLRVFPLHGFDHLARRLASWVPREDDDEDDGSDDGGGTDPDHVAAPTSAACDADIAAAASVHRTCCAQATRYLAPPRESLSSPLPASASAPAQWVVPTLERVCATTAAADRNRHDEIASGNCVEEMGCDSGIAGSEIRTARASLDSRIRADDALPGSAGVRASITDVASFLPPPLPPLPRHRHHHSGPDHQDRRRLHAPVPTLLVWGDSDTVCPTRPCYARWFEALRLSPALQTMIVPECGHNPLVRVLRLFDCCCCYSCSVVRVDEG